MKYNSTSPVKNRRVCAGEYAVSTSESFPDCPEIANREAVQILNHEIRTPLSLAKLYIQSAARFFLDDKAQLISLLEKAGQQLDNVASLAADAADFYKGFYGDEGVDFVFNLSWLTRDIVKAAEVLYPGFSFHSDCCEMAMIKGRQHQIAQVLHNYLNNAVKYSLGQTMIEVICKTVGNEAFVCVRDFGAGMHPSLSKVIFRSSTRLDNPQHEQVQGSGLGLAVVKRIIEAANGSVGVASVPGEGSNFYFRLPLSA